MLVACWPLQVQKSTCPRTLLSSQLYIMILKANPRTIQLTFLVLMLIIMQITSKNQENTSDQNRNDRQLLSKRIVQIQATNYKLASIIAQKEHIAGELRASNFKIEEQIEFRRSELQEIQDKLDELERMETELGRLQERERHLQSRHQDYLQLSTKLDRQLRFLYEQVQILKGKTIIEFNKVSEVREEVVSQGKERQILCRHLEQLRKGLSNLKKKIHQLKQQQKKKVGGRHRIQEGDVQREINALIFQKDNLKHQLEQQQANKDRLLTEERYKEMTKEIEYLKKENASLQQSKRLNVKLIDERHVLQQRIDFLKGIDIEFIKERRLLLYQLQEKHALLLNQHNSQTSTLHQKEQQLSQLQIAYPEGLSNFKKGNKRRRDVRTKAIKKVKEVYVQPKEIIVDEKAYRFKGHKLKRLLFIISGVMLALGLVLNHAIGYY